MKAGPVSAPMDNFILDQIISNIRIEVGHASGRNLSDPIPRSALTSASGVNPLGYEYGGLSKGTSSAIKAS